MTLNNLCIWNIILSISHLSVSLQCERLLILCLEAAYIHPPQPPPCFFSSTPPDCCCLAAYFSTDSCTLPFTPCENWCCSQHSTKEGTAGICTHVTCTTGTIPSNSGTQLQQTTEENWGGKADQTQLLFMSVVSYLFAISLIWWRTGGLYHYILSFPSHFHTCHSWKISTHCAQLCVLCMHKYKRLRNATLSHTYVHFSCMFLFCLSLWHCRCRDEFEWNWPLHNWGTDVEFSSIDWGKLWKALKSLMSQPKLKLDHSHVQVRSIIARTAWNSMLCGMLECNTMWLDRWVGIL